MMRSIPAKGHLLDLAILAHLVMVVVVGIHFSLFRPISLDQILEDLSWKIEDSTLARATTLTAIGRETGLQAFLEAAGGPLRSATPLDESSRISCGLALIWALSQPRLAKAAKQEILPLLLAAQIDRLIAQEEYEAFDRFLERRAGTDLAAMARATIRPRVMDRLWLRQLASEHPSPYLSWESRANVGTFLDLTALYREKGFGTAFKKAGSEMGKPRLGGERGSTLAAIAFFLWLAEKPEIQGPDRLNCLGWFFKGTLQVPTTPEMVLSVVQRLDSSFPQWFDGGARTPFLQWASGHSNRFFAEERRFQPVLSRLAGSPWPGEERAGADSTRTVLSSAREGNRE